ncbi:MAG: glycosyltransferase [Chloroflexi bacterium]|nr:glycosyltransferase [Chloroflexota bacterium]
MKILVFSTVFPLPARGACEQDRAAGLWQLQRMGHEVHLAVFLGKWQKPSPVENLANEAGWQTDCLPYPQKLDLGPRRWRDCLREIAFLDGATYQHTLPSTQNFIQGQIDSFSPDVIYMDYTFLWPIAALAKKSNIPVIIRSHNFEPNHLLDENGHSLSNYIRYIGKYRSEHIAIRTASAFGAITPREERLYRRWDNQNKVSLLPLRGLPNVLRPPRKPNNKKVLDVFFWGSTYNVGHNYAALKMVAEEIVPQVRRHALGEFRFHILGGKPPQKIAALARSDLIVHGFISDLENFLGEMDIALIPSSRGWGMQQKIFEPLARGFPTITNQRGLAGYPFEDKVHCMTASSPNDFAQRLLELRSSKLRQQLSEQSSAKSAELFSQEQLDIAMSSLIDRAIRHPP